MNGAVAALGKRKRASSLMKSASQLPTVEHSLEEFIARANQTLVDANTWAQADQQAREEEAKRREADAQRWKQAELQMRESEAREASLRRQLDGLQGKLAEAEARAAIAVSASSSASQAVANQDALADLRAQLEQAQQRLRATEDQTKRLSVELESARTESAAPRGTAVAPSEASDASTPERVRLAEKKATQALAAARAIAAGLTIAPADLAAIESGLTVPAPAPQKNPWPAIMGAFVGGIVLMFIIWKLAPSRDDRAPAAAQVPPPTQTAPAAQQAGEPAQQQAVEPAPAAATAPAQPTTPAPTTPPAPATAATPAPAAAPAPAPATATAPAPAAPKPTVTPIPVPTVTPIEEPKPAPAKPEAPRPAAPAPAPKPAKPAGGIVDPF